MLEGIIKDITIAKNSGAYISALSLALTLPNILSNIEYGERTNKVQYIEWFNKWVYKYYKCNEICEESDGELDRIGRETTKFDGGNCYKLRCALLHSGNSDLIDKNGNRNVDYFVLCTTDKYNHAAVCDLSNTGAKNIFISINIIWLIDSLIAGAKEYISKNNNKIERNKNRDMHQRTFGGIKIEEY